MLRAGFRQAQPAALCCPCLRLPKPWRPRDVLPRRCAAAAVRRGQRPPSPIQRPPPQACWLRCCGSRRTTSAAPYLLPSQASPQTSSGSCEPGQTWRPPASRCTPAPSMGTSASSTCCCRWRRGPRRYQRTSQREDSTRLIAADRTIEKGVRDLDMCAKLITCGADRGAADKHGRTALGNARISARDMNELQRGTRGRPTRTVWPELSRSLLRPPGGQHKPTTRPLTTTMKTRRMRRK